MGKCMGPCLCIVHVYLDRIVPRFGFYEHEKLNVWTCYECVLYAKMWYMWYDESWLYLVSKCIYINMTYIVKLAHLCMNEDKYEYVWSKGVIWNVYSHICAHTQMYDNIVNGGTFKDILKCTLNGMERYICNVHVKWLITWYLLMNSNLSPMI